jgi:phenylalanyl-tRNA synthetase alpha subunit
MEDHSEMRNDGEMEEEGSADYACICCSGAYESFDSITSVLEAKEKVNITKKITEKVAASKERICIIAASKERIERQNRKAELKASLERTPQEKLMDAYFEELRVKMEADEIEEKKKSCPIMIKSPCELLKRGSATCQCAECRGEHSDDSVHSEDCLDLLTTTHV